MYLKMWPLLWFFAPLLRNPGDGPVYNINSANVWSRS